MSKLPYKISKIPLFGSVFDYTSNPLKYYENLAKLNEPIVYDKLFGKYFYIVFDPEMIDEIFIKKAKNYEKNKFLKSFNDFFGEGLLTSDGDKWKKDRRVIQPTFSKSKIIQYSERILSETNLFLGRLENKTNINVIDNMTQLTLSVFLNSVLGIELNDEIYHSISETSLNCQEYLIKSSNPIGFLFSKFPTAYRKKYLFGIKNFEKIIFKIIESKRQDINKGVISNDLITSLLNVRYENDSPLTDKNLRDQVLTFLVAGHDTTAMTLSFAFHLFSSRLDIQEKIYAELIDLFPDKIIKIEKLNEAIFLNQFLLEVLRMYPTSWMIGRDSLEEDNIKGIKITKGAMVTLPIWAIHRDEKYYSKPDEFIPERWTNEFLATLPKQAFTPFGYGVRSCIGETFAMYEFKIILSSLLLNFKFKLVKNAPLEIVTIIMARPKEEFEVSFIRR